MPALGAEWPAYIEMHRSGDLAARARQAWEQLRRCKLCPRECGVDRIAGELGACRTGTLARVHGGGPHYSEESVLVGKGGSGTIFFVGCNMDCVFCQNHEVSHPLDDRELNVTSIGDAPGVETWRYANIEAGAGIWKATPRWAESLEYIARLMLGLQATGCENINLVSPSHVVPQILAALCMAAERGLHLPLVYNTGGYDSLSTLYLLDGVIDIYMPDTKYSDNKVGERLSCVRGYATHNHASIREMHRQVGDLVLDERGIAMRGLLVRHLVLPEGLAGTAETAKFLAKEVSRDTYVNVMDQYRPAHKADIRADVNRRANMAEHALAMRIAKTAGLRRLHEEQSDTISGC
jgi:putative pyruvate formate lyase activating enzyme